MLIYVQFTVRVYNMLGRIFLDVNEFDVLLTSA